MRDVLATAGDIGTIIAVPLIARLIYNLRRENDRLRALLRQRPDHTA